MTTKPLIQCKTCMTIQPWAEGKVIVGPNMMVNQHSLSADYARHKHSIE